MKYTVVKNDELNLIVRRFRLDITWQDLFEMNRDNIRSGNPHLIYPGEVLTLPDRSVTKRKHSVNRDAGLNEVTLFVEGKQYTGWKTCAIRDSLESAASTFDLTATELDQPVIIQEDSPVEITIGQDLVLTGYVDTTSPRVSSNEHSIRISGRSKTCDAVDCSAEFQTGQWFNVSPDQIARDLLRPYGIEVEIQEGLNLGGPLSVFKLQPGESILQAIERILRQRQVLITCNEWGDLVFTRSTQKEILPFSLVLGTNIMSGEASFSSKDRFSTYQTLGQQVGPSGSSRGSATDEKIQRFRKKIILPEEQTNVSSAVDRAFWEAMVRAARASSVTLDVQSWRTPEGKLWKRNTLVPVDASFLRINQDLLITDVEYKKGEDGTITTLTLKRADAYLPEPKGGVGKTLSKSNEVTSRFDASALNSTIRETVRRVVT